MKRRTPVFALVVFALCAFAPASPAPARAAEDPLAAVLKREGDTVSLDLVVRKKKRDGLERVLEIIGGAEPNAFATGFVVGEGLVMTAYHVVSGGLSAEKKTQLGFARDAELEVEAYVDGCEATVLRIDPAADLALLRVCGRHRQAAPPAFQPAPRQDERLLVIARPNGGKAVRRGVFSGTYTYRDQQYLAAKIEGRDGFSGSPVYNDRAEIVGVYVGYDSRQRVALISPGARAQKLLEDYAARRRP